MLCSAPQCLLGAVRSSVFTSGGLLLIGVLLLGAGGSLLWGRALTRGSIEGVEVDRAPTPRAVASGVLAAPPVLFLLLGSVVLPFKAVLMNLLSIARSSGALVRIFQDGHFSRLLRLRPGPHRAGAARPSLVRRLRAVDGL